jgi:hypothetical protein
VPPEPCGLERFEKGDAFLGTLLALVPLLVLARIEAVLRLQVDVALLSPAVQRR